MKITFVLLFLSTIAFSQSDKKVMLSDKVKELMLEELGFDYDSAFYLYNPEKGMFHSSERESIPKSAIVLMLENMMPVCGLVSNRDFSKFPLIVFDGIPVDNLNWELEYKKSSYTIKAFKDFGSTTFCNPRVDNGVITIISKKHKKRRNTKISQSQ
jgi:hypothetical protein